ncbi:MAG: hypothetical protein PHQ36_06265, partial [Anaerolineales bacterium]|nr:hypothetical protein [Anaerolineales bacterium]
MKKIIPFLFFLFFLAACVAPASPPEQPTQVVPLAATPTLIILPPTPQPAVRLPTLTPLPPPQTLPSTPVYFGLGRAWTDVQDSIDAGESKTYVLNAMQGQIMSVSISGGYFPLQIQGRDGTVLCPVERDRECAFWRGALPLSQDYFITVNSGSATNFSLRIAINPPDALEQTFRYTDPATGSTLTYSDQFAPADIP